MDLDRHLFEEFDVPALNRCMFIGNVGREPETRFFETGGKVTRFRIAVDRVTGTGDARTEVTLWLDCVAERQLAEVAQAQVRRGSLVYVEGFLNVRDYKDRSGQPRQATELVLRDLQIIERREPAVVSSEPAADDDLTFD